MIVNCPEIENEENAQWNETLSNGQTVNGKCVSGYQGSVSRSCIQYDSVGNWSSISGSCGGNFSFFFFQIIQFWTLICNRYWWMFNK